MQNQRQTSPDSPTSILDASVNDLNGDGIPDLVVLENSGPTYFVNDSTGNMVYDKVVLKPKSRAIETYDVNRDGMMDMLIATDQGVVVQFANDHLVYSDFQTVLSGNTVDLVLYDFDADNSADMVTVDTSGFVRFYRNHRAAGFVEVGSPVQVGGAGKLEILDMDNDGQMDVVVEAAPGVTDIVHVGGIFGIQGSLPSGKRAIRFVLFDHLGTAKILTDNRGNVEWPGLNGGTNELLPFGKEYPIEGVNNRELYNLTFTNKELDRELDLHYFGARYYQATLPRFISPDPVGGRPEIPLSWNRYLYCQNDPLNYYDPTGLTTEMNEQTSVVVNVVDDGDTKILAYPYVGDERAEGPPQMVGESYQVDTFSEGNVIHVDQDITDKLYASVKPDSESNLTTALESGPGKKYDIKNTWGYKHTDGVKFEGKYATMRDMGNILAGINAKKCGISFEKFQRMAGAVHQEKGKSGIFFAFLGKQYGEKPYYGEVERQYWASRMGYFKFYPLYLERSGKN